VLAALVLSFAATYVLHRKEVEQQEE
jgi:hypothetical protein